MSALVPRLSVVIPTFNNEAVLRRCLTSWQLSAAALGELSEAYRGRVLKNGLLFHARWGHVSAGEHVRSRRVWPRQTTSLG